MFLLLGGKGYFPCPLLGFEDFGKHLAFPLVVLAVLRDGAVSDATLPIVGVLVGEEA